MRRRGAPQGAPFFHALCLIACLGLTACSRHEKFEVLGVLRTGAFPSGMALSPDGSAMAVACQRSNDVWIVPLDGAAASHVDTLPLPQDVIYSPDWTKVLVSESGGDSIAQLSLDEMRVTRRFKVLGQPSRLQAFQDQSRLLISSLSETGVGVFRLPRLRNEKMLSMDGFCQRILESADGKALYAVTRDSPAFLSFRVADLSEQISVLVKGSPVDLALDPEGNFAWVAGAGNYFEQEDGSEASNPGAITCIRLSDMRAVDSGDTCAAIRALLLSKSGRWIFAACGEEGELRVLNSQNFEEVAKLPLAGNPSELLLSPDGSRIYVAQTDLKRISIVSCGPWQ
jgi:DNA-binding beta-propeller fold protein YncE